MTSRKPRPHDRMKRHHTERFITNSGLKERWTNEQSAWIGFRHGRQESSFEIAEAMGVHPATVRAMIKRRWKLPPIAKPGMQVMLDRNLTRKAERLAKRKGVTVETLLATVVGVVLKDDLYEAVCPD